MHGEGLLLEGGQTLWDSSTMHRVLCPRAGDSFPLGGFSTTNCTNDQTLRVASWDHSGRYVKPRRLRDCFREAPVVKCPSQDTTCLGQNLALTSYRISLPKTGQGACPLPPEGEGRETPQQNLNSSLHDTPLI